MEKIIYEYCLVRYVPDLERGEFVNVGLLMMCKKQKWMKCEIDINETRIERLSGPVNISLLKKQSEVFTRTDVPFKNLPTEEKYRWLAAVKSAILQTSPTHPGILFSEPTDFVNSLNQKFDQLFNRLVK
ncbi:MAG: DUF3037 domain-containing protein [Bacteroides sp.]|nr:DUF3037 domain-containing protein [Bacteroidales bacterium]MBD5223734.1 DUF3037 domain-containing protein [Bacteroidales bacterium]MBD5305389.1 DUF3037 domain-containing protein [Bacteroides sp.]MBD5347870.1 DUF3037 domain-containing protein [Bacteroides sp.]